MEDAGFELFHPIFVMQMPRTLVLTHEIADMMDLVLSEDGE